MAFPKIGTNLETARFATSEPSGSTQPQLGGSARLPVQHQHEALVGRSMSQPLDGGRLRRNAQLEQPASPHAFSSASLSVQMSPASSPSSSILSQTDRSDRHTDNRETGQQPPAARSWRATVTNMLGQLASGASTTASATANKATALFHGGVNAASTGAGVVKNALATGAGVVKDGVVAGAGVVKDGVVAGAGVVKDGAVFTAGEIKAQAQALGVAVPPRDLMGAMAGHVIHQSASVGVPTFLREMMAEGLVLAMRHMPPDHVAAIQLASGVATVGVQLYRRAMEKRNPDEAARGFHALSQQQWNALDEPAKKNLRTLQVFHSRMVTNLQFASSLTHLAISFAAAKSDDPALAELPARILATDLKAATYATMRDSVQATFSMVSVPGTTGVSGSHMNGSASFFSFMAMVTNYGFSNLPGQVPNADLASQVLRGTQPEGTVMTSGEAWKARAAVAGVKAAINTTLHAADWIYMTQEEAKQAKSKQQWAPSSNLFKPDKRDYSRIKDHVPTRIALLAGGNSLGNLISFAMRHNAGWKSTMVGNVADAAYQGLIYKTIVGTWQAQGEVRAAVRAEAAAARNPTATTGGGDIEMGTVPPQSPPTTTPVRSRSL